MSNAYSDGDSGPRVEPVADRVRDTSWSANLERPVHREDRSILIEQAIEAIEHTAAGSHVNLVTHSDHGHPSRYLYARLDERFGETITYGYIQQCGCGGYVTKVRVRRER